MPDYTSHLTVATEAARAAGRFLMDNFRGKRDIHFKGKAADNNPASEADKGAERIVIDTICQAFPGHCILSEEAGEQAAASDYRWVIDPLDGTVNYLHQYPVFGTSVAMLHNGEIVVAAVYSPVHDEMFAAVKGKGTTLNGRPVHVSTVSELRKGLFGAGFPYDRDSEEFKRSLGKFAFFARYGQAVRREGSTALSLCNVACGRYDGFSVSGNDLWDYAAGVLLVTEAGGRVTDFDGQPFSLAKQEVLATNGQVHDLVVNGRSPLSS